MMQFINECPRCQSLIRVLTQDGSAEPKTYNYELFLCVYGLNVRQMRGPFSCEARPWHPFSLVSPGTCVPRALELSLARNLAPVPRALERLAKKCHGYGTMFYVQCFPNRFFHNA
jgi:hypothetical protein